MQVDGCWKAWVNLSSRIFASSQSISLKIVMHNPGENSSSTMERTGRQNPDHTIKAGIASNKTRQHREPRIQRPAWKAHMASLVFCPKGRTSISPWEHIGQTQTERQSVRHLTSSPQECQGHERQGEVKKLLETGRHKGAVTLQREVLGWLLGQLNNYRTLMEELGKSKWSQCWANQIVWILIS